MTHDLSPSISALTFPLPVSVPGMGQHVMLHYALVLSVSVYLIHSTCHPYDIYPSQAPWKSLFHFLQYLGDIDFLPAHLPLFPSSACSHSPHAPSPSAAFLFPFPRGILKSLFLFLICIYVSLFNFLFSLSCSQFSSPSRHYTCTPLPILLASPCLTPSPSPHLPLHSPLPNSIGAEQRNEWGQGRWWVGDLEWNRNRWGTVGSG